MPSEPDFTQDIPKSQGAGRALHLKQMGPRFGPNKHAGAIISIKPRLMEAAKMKVLSSDQFRRTATDLSQMKGAQQMLGKMIKGDPTLSELVTKFTIQKTGTVSAPVRKIAGLNRYGSTFGEIADIGKSTFAELKKTLTPKLKEAFEAIKTAAQAGDKSATALLKDSKLMSAVSRLKDIGMAQIMAEATVPAAVEKAKEEEKEIAKKQGT
jgi:hypothetical protein